MMKCLKLDEGLGQPTQSHSHIAPLPRGCFFPFCVSYLGHLSHPVSLSLSIGLMPPLQIFLLIPPPFSMSSLCLASLRRVNFHIKRSMVLHAPSCFLSLLSGFPILHAPFWLSTIHWLVYLANLSSLSRLIEGFIATHFTFCPVCPVTAGFLCVTIGFVYIIHL